MVDAIRLSVVIPTHDTRELTLACLHSVLAATRIQLEVIVVDDAGTDGTAEAVAENHPDVQVLRIDNNVGFTRAANRGMAAASGEILLLLNSDTEVAAGGLHNLMTSLDTQPQTGIAGAELFYPDGSPQWAGGKWPTTAWLFGLASGLPAVLGAFPGYRRLKPEGAAGQSDWVSGAAMAVRRQVWDQIGPFDTSYSFYCQDLDLCYRASRARWLVAVAAGFRVVHHHGATITAAPGAAGRANPSLLWVDLLRFVRNHYRAGAARRARRALCTGVRLRLVARSLVGVLKRGSARSRWRSETESLAAALAAVRSEFPRTRRLDVEIK